VKYWILFFWDLETIRSYIAVKNANTLTFIYCQTKLCTIYTELKAHLCNTISSDFYRD